MEDNGALDVVTDFSDNAVLFLVLVYNSPVFLPNYNINPNKISVCGAHVQRCALRFSGPWPNYPPKALREGCSELLWHADLTRSLFFIQ